MEPGCPPIPICYKIPWGALFTEPPSVLSLCHLEGGNHGRKPHSLPGLLVPVMWGAVAWATGQPECVLPQSSTCFGGVSFYSLGLLGMGDACGQVESTPHLLRQSNRIEAEGNPGFSLGE